MFCISMKTIPLFKLPLLLFFLKNINVIICNIECMSYLVIMFGIQLGLESGVS